MNKTLIWDIPARLFHWAFALSLTVSLGIGLTVDDDSPLFQLHMLSGLVALFLLVVRIILGLVGSRHARFANFPLRPAEAARYLAGALTGKTRTFAGNNPGSALAALAMFAIVPLLVVTGAGTGGETGEEVHEVLAYALLSVVGAHLFGLLLHTFWHRDNLATAMITGRKNVAPDEGLRSAHPVWGLVLLLTSAAWIIALFSNHDATAATVQLPLTSATVQLGEKEIERGDQGAHGHEREDRADDAD